MANKKLQEIGSKLGVSEKDIADIRRQRIKRKLLAPLIGAIVVACSAGIGFLAGVATPTDGGGYPYAATGLAMVGGAKVKKGGLILVAVLLAVIAAVAAYRAGQHSSFHGVEEYGVFSRQK